MHNVQSDKHKMCWNAFFDQNSTKHLLTMHLKYIDIYSMFDHFLFVRKLIKMINSLTELCKLAAFVWNL